MSEEKNFIEEEVVDGIIADFKMPWEETPTEEETGGKPSGGKPKTERPSKGLQPALKLEEVLGKAGEFIEPTSETDDEQEDVVESGDKPEQEEPEATPLEETEIDSSSSAVSNLYKLFAKANHERGVLPQFSDELFDKLLEEKKNPVDVLVELNKQAISQEVDSYKESLPPVIKTIIENYEEGVPLTELIKAKDMQMRYDLITPKMIEEQEDVCKALIVQDAMSRGETLEEALEVFNGFQEAGIEDKMATKALARLKSHEANRIKAMATKATEDAKAEKVKMEAELESLKTFVGEATEIIPGVPLSAADKASILKVLTEPVEVIKQGNMEKPVSAIQKLRSRNPMAFDRTLAYLLSLGVFNLDDKHNPKPVWDKVIKRAKSKAVSDFSQVLEQSSADLVKFSTSGRKVEDRTGGAAGDFLEAFDALTKGRK